MKYLYKWMIVIFAGLNLNAASQAEMKNFQKYGNHPLKSEQSDIDETVVNVVFDRYSKFEYWKNSNHCFGYNETLGDFFETDQEKQYEPYALGDERIYKKILLAELQKNPRRNREWNITSCFITWMEPSMGEDAFFNGIKFMSHYQKVANRLGRQYFPSTYYAMMDSLAKSSPKLSVNYLGDLATTSTFLEFEDFWKAAMSLGSYAYDFLKPILDSNHSDSQVVKLFAQTFKEVSENRSVPDLEKLLETNPDHAEFIIEALTKQGTDEAYRILYRKLNSDSIGRKKPYVMASLLAFSSKRPVIIPMAVKMIEIHFGTGNCAYPNCKVKAVDSEDYLYLNLMSELIKLHVPQAANILATIVKDRSYSDGYGVRMTEMASQYSHPFIVDALKESLLRSADHPEFAAYALAKLGVPGIAPDILASYLKTKNDKLTLNWFRVFEILGDKIYKPILDDVVQNEDINNQFGVVMSAASTLVKIEGNLALAKIKVLMDQLDEHNVFYTMNFARLYELLQTIEPNSYADFENVLKKVKNVSLRRRLIRNFATRNGEKSLAVLVRLAKNDSYLTRESATCALSEMKNSSMVSFFETVAKTEPYWLVRRCAVDALISELETGNTSVKSTVEKVAETDPSPVLRKKANDAL